MRLRFQNSTLNRAESGSCDDQRLLRVGVLQIIRIAPARAVDLDNGKKIDADAAIFSQPSRDGTDDVTALYFLFVGCRVKRR